MKMVIRLLIVCSVLAVGTSQAAIQPQIKPAEDKLPSLELSAREILANFTDLTKKISIPDVSKSIVAHDEVALKDALQDVISLNRTITCQIDTAIGFWNLYLDSVAAPSKEGYLLGQVMSSFLGTMRSLFLRSSVDQAMILSLIKKNFDQAQPAAAQAGMNQAIDVKQITIEDRWKDLRIK